MYKDIVYFGIAIGLEDHRYEMALDYGASVICIDVANGYLDSVKHFCERVANHISIYSYDCLLMSGNVVTYDGVKDLSDVGVRLIRIGIGTGNLCTTRQATGVGYGQITALENCAYAKPDYIKLVADGGIRSSGDVVKALAAGADLVMIGSLLGHTYESEHNGEIYGMASRKLQEDFYHQVRSVEGTIQSMEKTTSLDDFLSEFVYGIKHGFTYLGVNNIQDLQRSAEFVEIK
jgi:IMP dehydrogenase